MVMTLLIVLLAILLLTLQIFTIEVSMMLTVILFILFGLLTPEEGMSGFSNPATITIIAMLVLSSALEKSGAIAALGRSLTRVSGSPTLFLALLILVVGSISAFASNTGVVAIFLPLVVAVAHEKNIAPSKWLIPLSYSSQAGGVCTLIGTSSTLLVNSMYVKEGYTSISMFEMGQLGLILLGVTALYFVLFGRYVLPERKGEMAENYHLKDYTTELRVMSDSPLIGTTLEEDAFFHTMGIKILKLMRNHKSIPLHHTAIDPDDCLIVKGNIKEILALNFKQKLEIESDVTFGMSKLEDNLLLTEIIVAPGSRFIGKSLKNIDFHNQFNCIVLAVKRMGRTFNEKINALALQPGDCLLVQGSPENLVQLKQSHDVIVLREMPHFQLNLKRAIIMCLVIVSVIMVAALQILPIMVSAIIGCIIAVLTRCIKMGEVYEAIDWRVIFLVGGSFAIGLAIFKSGASTLMANYFMKFIGSYGPFVGVTVIYLITSILTELMSNTATAAIVVPIAITMANNFGVDPKPFVLAVAFAASTSFSTPIGYQTNTMIFASGGYKFFDFMRAGIPLNVIFWIISSFLIPIFWPY